jgi:hypothetical protein
MVTVTVFVVSPAAKVKVVAVALKSSSSPVPVVTAVTSAKETSTVDARFVEPVLVTVKVAGTGNAPSLSPSPRCHI